MHVAILVYDTDGRDPNLLVEPLGLVVDCCVPRQLSRSTEPTNHSPTRAEVRETCSCGQQVRQEARDSSGILAV